MDEKEVVTGNPDTIVEFADTMAQWYSSYKSAADTPQPSNCSTDKCSTDNCSTDKCSSVKEKFSTDHTWMLHVLPCMEHLPGAPRLKRAELSPLKQDDYKGKSIVMVTDEKGHPLGFDVLPENWYIINPVKETLTTSTVNTTLIINLLQRCTQVPMFGGSRRPLRIKPTDRILHRLMDYYLQNRTQEDPVGPLSTITWEQFNPNQNQKHLWDFTLRWPPVYYCNACKRRPFSSKLMLCDGCKVVHFCKDQCSPGEEHRRWCERLRKHSGNQLEDMPFTYKQEVTATHFSLEDFLFKNKLDRGYWVHWTLMVRSQPEVSSDEEREARLEHDWFQSHVGCYGHLNREAAILKSIPNTILGKPLEKWNEYLKWRGLDSSSFVFPLLSSVLSVYYIITSLVPKHFPGKDILKKQSLRIHLIETYREFRTLATFWELTVLLPNVNFDLVFVCEHLCSWTHNKKLYIYKTINMPQILSTQTTENILVTHFRAFTRLLSGIIGEIKSADVTVTTEPPLDNDRKTIRVKVHRGPYLTLEDKEPDLVIGFRPKFVKTKSTWYKILPKLKSLKVPAYFSEISEYRCESSADVVNETTGGTVSPPTMNPFHCPLRLNGGDNKLPRYRNAFIFHLIYESLVHQEKALSLPSMPALPVSSPPGQPRRDRKENAVRRRGERLNLKDKKKMGLNKKHKK